MDKELQQFTENFRHIVLKVEEKQRVRHHLFAYMEKNPRPVSPGFFSSLTFYKYAIGGTMAFGLMLMAGLSFWAEQSLPGDIAYPIKIEVNESIREAIAVSEEAELSWDITEAERRMEEADQLASREGI